MPDVRRSAEGDLLRGSSGHLWGWGSPAPAGESGCYDDAKTEGGLELAAIIVRWVLVFVIGFIGIPLNGAVLSALWGWFVVPVTGARQIGIAEGVGIVTVAAFLGRIATAHMRKVPLKEETPADVDWNEFSKRGLGVSLNFAILSPLGTLVFGWIVHTFFVATF